MPNVKIQIDGLEMESSTPTHISFGTFVDGKVLQYQLTIQDEGLILEDIDGDIMSTLVQELYADHPSMSEPSEGMDGRTVYYDDGEVQVCLHTETGEGWSGDYDPNDPSDSLLYRFDVNRKEGDKWIPVDNASYCTAIRSNVSEQVLVGYLHLIHDQVKDKVRGGVSIKKICERLSWIGSGDKSVDADVPPVP